MGRPSRLSSGQLQTLLERAPEAAVSCQQPKERSHKEIPQELLSLSDPDIRAGGGGTEGLPTVDLHGLGAASSDAPRGRAPSRGSERCPRRGRRGCPVPGHGHACSGREWAKNITCTTSWPVVPCRVFPA